MPLTPRKSMNKGDKRDPEKVELYGAVWMVGVLGFTVVTTITGTFLLGLFISRKYDLGAAPIIVGIFSGVALSFWWVYRNVTKHLVGKDKLLKEGKENHE
jgi:hypothetical protein